MHTIVLVIIVWLLKGQPIIQSAEVSNPYTCTTQGKIIKEKLLTDDSVRGAEYACLDITETEKT